MKIYRRLYTKRTFWGLVRVQGGGWRIGFGFGFLEFGTPATGIWLPRKGKMGKESGKEFLKLIYDLELDSSLPGFSEQLKKTPRAYEIAFNYWLDDIVHTAEETNENTRR